MPDTAAATRLPITSHQTEFVNLNNELNKNVKFFTQCVESLLDNFKSNEELSDMKKGISFLSMKNMLMIEYLSNLLQLIYMKTNGEKLAGSPCVLRLAELRCIIEKTKSIEVKLKYQIDKLLKMAISITSDELDPLSFKPNLSDFSKKGEKREADEDDEKEDESDEDIIRDKDEDEDEVKTKSGVYVPPKLAPVHYDLDETPQERARRQMERLQRRAINSSIMRELETEYSGAPEEIRERYANTLAMETAEQKHKREYEEENFVRKPLTKKEMMQTKRLKLGTNLNTITSFDDARLLLDENINMEEFLVESKKKKGGKKDKKAGKKGKKGGKKRKIRYT